MNPLIVAHIGWLASYHLRRRAGKLALRNCAGVLYTDHIPHHIDTTNLPYEVVCLPPKLTQTPLAMLSWLQQDLDHRKIDIIHSHSTHYPASLGLFCSDVVRINTIWDFVHSKDPLSPLFHRAILEGLETRRLAEAVSFSSPVVRRQWINRGYPVGSAFLHSWGVDLDIFRKRGGKRAEKLRSSLGIADHELVVLSSRSTSPPANLDILVQAIFLLRKQLPVVRLVVIGGTVTREIRWLEYLFKNDSERESVIFSGTLHNDYALSDFYEMADVVASIHTNDHNPATVLESLAMGRPVVVCDIPSVTHWVRDGQTGFVVPERDVEATARALYRALTLSGHERRAMSNSGKQLITEQADFAKALDKVAADYTVLAKSQRSPGPGAYERGLLLDICGQPHEAAEQYKRAIKTGEAPEIAELLLQEKQHLIDPWADPEYFSMKRAQAGMVELSKSLEDQWSSMVEALPVPQSMFRHDFIAGLWPLLDLDPQSCLRMLQVLARRFAGDYRPWVCEAIQWFGRVLGKWEDCSRLLLCLRQDGGTTLAIHALGCARELGAQHEDYRPLLERAVCWSTSSIAFMDPELDRLFRIGVHDEALALLAGDRPSVNSVIEQSRVYATTDRFWSFLYRQDKNDV